jgi:hypothetical protein
MKHLKKTATPGQIDPALRNGWRPLYFDSLCG